MGSKYEVTVWKNENLWGWHAAEFWSGDNLLSAIYHLWKAKRTGTGRATLHWR